MDGAERDRLTADFTAARAEGLSITAAIDRVAAACGRSSNAVRAVVCESPASTGRVVDGARRRRFIDRALERGVSIGSIADRIQRSTDVIRRADLDRRRRRILDAIPDSEPVAVANAGRPEAAEVFAVAGAVDGLARELAVATFGDWLERVRALPEIEDDETTRSRIAAMHYALSRARSAFARIEDIKRPGDRRLDPIESACGLRLGSAGGMDDQVAHKGPAGGVEHALPGRGMVIIDGLLVVGVCRGGRGLPVGQRRREA